MNRTFIPGRLIRAMRARATPLGLPEGNRTRVISSSICFGYPKASIANSDPSPGKLRVLVPFGLIRSAGH